MSISVLISFTFYTFSQPCLFSPKHFPGYTYSLFALFICMLSCWSQPPSNNNNRRQTCAALCCFMLLTKKFVCDFYAIYKYARKSAYLHSSSDFPSKSSRLWCYCSRCCWGDGDNNNNSLHACGMTWLVVVTTWKTCTRFPGTSYSACINNKEYF